MEPAMPLTPQNPAPASRPLRVARTPRWARFLALALCLLAAVPTASAAPAFQQPADLVLPDPPAPEPEPRTGQASPFECIMDGIFVCVFQPGVCLDHESDVATVRLRVDKPFVYAEAGYGSGGVAGGYSEYC